MAKYFKNVKSFEDLKGQFKTLLKANHPDNGGDVSKMQEINAEYDALFKIWKDRHETQTGETVTETAESTRRHFYTEYGWEGSRYNCNLATTDISKIIKAYTKEKYPTWKFSVTSKYFSGGSSILICVMEAPVDIFDREYFKLPKHDGWGRIQGYRHDCWNFEKMDQEGSYYMQLHSIRNREDEPWLNDIGYEVLKDVYSFMQSYNYDDSDSMIDYFSCNFYSSIYIGKYDKGFKIIPKTARIKSKNAKPSKTEKKEPAPTAEPEAIEQKTGYTYKITKGEDTRDGSELWIVRIVETLSKDEYIAENKKMKERGSYYSRFLHGFIFRFNPSEILMGVA